MLKSILSIFLILTLFPINLLKFALKKSLIVSLVLNVIGFAILFGLLLDRNTTPADVASEVTPVLDGRDVGIVGDKPFYIYSKKTVAWHDLAPDLGSLYGTNVEKRIVGTFPSPSALVGSDLEGITADDEVITFPEYGSYYLHTTIGFLKIHLLNPNLDPLEQVVSQAKFVSGNIVHSMADRSIIYPRENGITFPEHLQKTFFASDQPLKLHCGHASMFLAHIFHEQGMPVQLVELYNHEKAVHVVMQVFVPSLEQYIMIDPDYGVIVRDKSNRYLSIQEVAVLSKAGAELRFRNIGQKSWLKPEYNNAEPMPNFAWSPNSHSTNQCFTFPQYAEVIEDYTYQYYILEKVPGGWNMVNKYTRNGETF